MNGMSLTQSEGEGNTRKNDLVVSLFYGSPKQQWVVIPQN